MLQNIEASTTIISPADKFYDFFRNKSSDIINVFPASFRSVEVLEGTEGSVSCAKLWNFITGGISVSSMLKFEAIDDQERSITYTAVDGDLLHLHKTFKATLTISDGSIKWVIEYEKAETAPIPQAYAALAIEACKMVDLYLVGSSI